MESKHVLHCNRGDYTTGIINDPYGIPAALCKKAAEWHEKAHKGHKVKVKNV